MAATPQAHIDRLRTPHTHANGERCPLCNQSLPHDVTAAGLLAKLKDKEQQAIRTVEQRLHAAFTQDLKAKLEEAKQQAASKAAERENEIRLEASKQARAAAKDDLAKANKAKLEADQAKRSAEQQVKRLKAEQEVQLKERTQKALAEQRQALDKDKEDAVYKAKADEFAKNQKLQKQVEQLKRQLEQQTANNLGEGAEIDLHEALRDSFDSLGDKITRIKKGQPGADIRHEVHHNGQLCGLIVYDSKNHAQWRSSFVTKLKADQLAARADHAILTTAAFPKGEHQLVRKNGVIVVNPARAVELVQLIREHIVTTHRLRLSATEKNEKMEALYRFINSDRCRQLLDRYESITDQLMKIDEKEVAAHELVWKKRGQLLRDVQKTHATYKSEIDRIIEESTPV